MKPASRARVLSAAAVLTAAAVLGAGCGRGGPEAPTRETVTALLQKEADALKRDGEKLDPVLRIKATWTIEGVDVAERPGDADRPFSGTIRFRIRSETKDEQGAVGADEFSREFHYVYTSSLNRWIFEMRPSPAP